MATTRKLFVSTIAMAVVLLSTMSIHAEQADKYTKPHEPFTAPGLQVRMSIVNPINNNSWQGRIQPTVFQEIAPCRLSSTLSRDRYDTPWGGTAYLPNEARLYRSRGVLATPMFVDPCSEAIPIEAIGIVGRFTVTPGDGDGEVHIDPTQPGSPNATTVFKFKKGEILMFEAGVMLGPDGTFGVQTWNAGADVTVDILGYLLPDPNTDKGEKGDRGDQGETGATGATGPKGDTGAIGPIGPKGDTGAAGAIGPKGDTGATGAKGDTGATGAIGPKGDTGAIGAKGDKGDTGAIGAKGDKGDTGAMGAKGDKGDTGAIGPKGDKGDTGSNGAKGDKGDTGAIGPKGDKGDTGADGVKGDKGDKGDTGANGEKGDKGDTGATGNTGDKGEKGDKGDKGDKGEPGGLTVVKGNNCYPPGNNANSQLTVSDNSVHASSVVILNYTDAGSNGNALAIISQTEGSFQTTGSPNRCFQYAIFNNAQ
ncbi:MAG TPA: hypothetical protein VHX14_07225 [Thermoanaerobaculia bacterium]|nr:hypothetical protein [Thermoanaerobaculia bacterium]